MCLEQSERNESYYESYLTNPQAQALIPSKELVERILNTNNKFYESMMNEYYASIPEYKENRARIDEQCLLDKDDGYDASAYQNSGNQISTNLKQVNGKYIEYPILLVYAGGLSEYLDATLIHELNHVYELHLQYLDGNSYQMVCGWDILCGKINNKMLKEVSLQARCEKRNYELFNEIINELLAQEISKILSENGLYIFNTKDDKKIKGGSSYERTKVLISVFYDRYKKEIIESRKGNIQVLFDAVGKENFESLNHLFYEFNENFPEFTYYQLYRDLNAGKETELTNKLKEIIAKRDAILQKMEEHYQMKKIQL